jgi:hypothetical protein
MPAFLALALCDACSKPQAQVPAAHGPSRAASADEANAAADAPAAGVDGRAPDHSSNRQPRTDAR